MKQNNSLLFSEFVKDVIQFFSLKLTVLRFIRVLCRLVLVDALHQFNQINFSLSPNLTDECCATDSKLVLAAC